MKTKLIAWILVIATLLTIVPANTIAVSTEMNDNIEVGYFSNGSDYAIYEDREYYSNLDDQDHLYVKTGHDDTGTLVLEEHVISMIASEDILYLLVYRNKEESALLAFDPYTHESIQVVIFDGVVASISLRDHVLYLLKDGAIEMLNLVTGNRSVLMDDEKVTLFYLSEYDVLKFKIEGSPSTSLQAYRFSDGTIMDAPIADASPNTVYYTPRTTEPARDNPYYTTLNIFHQCGYGMAPNIGNCTCYAFGRSYENLGTEPKLSHGDAGQWYDYNKNHGYYSYGSTPVLGSVVVWKSSGAGHVAVVEIIDGDTVITSESGWKSFYFKTKTRSKSHYNLSASSSYSLQGFIYVLGKDVATTPSDTTAPVITNTKVVDIDENGYTVSCTVTDDNGVNRVQFPTWTDYAGQDDLFSNWETNPAASGTKNGDTFTYRVNISDHNYEKINYVTHIYAYDNYGNVAKLEGVFDWIAIQYTITYDANGGSSVPAAQKKTHGTALELTEATPYRDDYDFAGWATTADAEIAEYLPGDSYTEEKSAVLYAVWDSKACKHNYTSARVDATCMDYGYTTYTCTKCGDTYTVYDGDYTEWSTTKPVGFDEDLIESKTQYRYADKETKTSYEPSLSGWTRVDSSWEPNGSGSVTYVKSWPSGFVTSHSLYGTYNKSPKTASETTTDKTTINSDNVTGYLYYHWCRGDYQNGPDNRKSRPTKQEDCDTFCAFYSTTPPNSLTPAGDGDGSYRYDKGDCCRDSYWYFYTPVNTQNYTTYRNLFSYERWGTWSDWSDTVYTGSSSRKVETRTLYRAVEVELGDHDYQYGYCSVCGAEDPGYNFEPVILGVADVSAAPGETVTIPVTISDNTGFAGFTLCIDYNESVMTLTNISKGSLLNTSESGAFTKNVSGKTINWVDSANIMGDGELMKLTFTIEGDATPGSYDVGLSLKDGNSANFVDENSRAIHVEFESGSVSVQEPAPVVVLEKIEVATKPTKTVYQIGESLDTTGLTLKATYSDGTTKKISSGFTVSGFDSATAGTKTVTVKYEGKMTTFTVTVEQKEVDPNGPKIVVASKTVSCGGTVTLDVDITNNPGFSVLNVAFLYNKEYLTLTKIENLLTSMTMTQDSTVVWDATDNHTGDGTICRLTFEVSKDAPEGDYEIQVLFISASNDDFEEVAMTGVSGTLKVSAVIYGDVNGDGKIASVDLAMLRKYIASVDPITGESGVAIKPGADCNGDGKVNSIDLAMLRKYLASIDPITGESTVKMGP